MSKYAKGLHFKRILAIYHYRILLILPICAFQCNCRAYIAQAWVRSKSSPKSLNKCFKN